MELSEIIAELENYTGKFPRQALEEAIAQREAITPLLLDNLEKWKDNLEELAKLPDYFLHIYALYLLAQFKESQAYPLIIEFFSAPGDISLAIAEGVVTGDLGRILATVSEGKVEPLKKLLENPQVNEYVRSAAVDALIVLVAEGVISRELVIEYFESLFKGLLEEESNPEQKPNYICTVLVTNSAVLYPLELKPYIERAFESELVDPFFIEEEDVDYYLQQGQEATLDELRSDYSSYSFIEDTIAEIEWWACFQENRLKPTKTQPLEKTQPLGLEQLTLSPPKKSNKSKKKAKKKMQKQSRRKNRSQKK